MINFLRPQVRKHYEPVFEFQAGFGFDLAALGGVASDLYKGLGGAK